MVGILLVLFVYELPIGLGRNLNEVNKHLCTGRAHDLSFVLSEIVSRFLMVLGTARVICRRGLSGDGKPLLGGGFGDTWGRDLGPAVAKVSGSRLGSAWRTVLVKGFMSVWHFSACEERKPLDSEL